MPITDTWPLGPMLNAKDRHQEVFTTLLRRFRRFRGPIIVPAPIVTEIAYLLQIELGPAVKATFLNALARGALIVEATTTPSRTHGIGPTMP